MWAKSYQIISLALGATAIMFLVATPLQQTHAQSSTAPNWWVQVGANLECGPSPVAKGLIVCSVKNLSGRTETYRPTELEVRIHTKEFELLQLKEGQAQISIRMQKLPWGSEGIEGKRPFTLAGFGLEKPNSVACPEANTVASDILQKAGINASGGFTQIYCRWTHRMDGSNRWVTEIVFDLSINPPVATTPKKPGQCNTNLLNGPWKAEMAALAKAGHSVTFAAAPNVPKHDDGQVAQRGTFSVYPGEKPKLAALPNPLFTAQRGYDVGQGLCLIPVVSQRDSGTSRSAILIDAKAGMMRFLNDMAYRWTSKGYELAKTPTTNHIVTGLGGIWRRGTAAALAPSCTPADFNGRWNRSDGAKITIRGAGTDGVGGTASMDENPGDWVRGQDKYVSMRMKEPCVYTAKCFASQRTVVNGRPDFKMIESACEIVLDPVTKKLRERGTGNSYTYTRAVAARASAAPPATAVSSPNSDQPSEEVRALNAEQAAITKRKVDGQAATAAAEQAAYRRAIAEHKAKVAEYNRKVAEAANKAREDRAKWEAAVAACKAGDRTQCASSP